MDPTLKYWEAKPRVLIFYPEQGVYWTWPSWIYPRNLRFLL